MDFKPSIKALWYFLVLLVILGAGIIASSGAISYGGIYAPAGLINLVCLAFGVGTYIKYLIKNKNL